MYVFLHSLSHTRTHAPPRAPHSRTELAAVARSKRRRCLSRGSSPSSPCAAARRCRVWRCASSWSAGCSDTAADGGGFSSDPTGKAPASTKKRYARTHPGLSSFWTPIPPRNGTAARSTSRRSSCGKFLSETSRSSGGFTRPAAADLPPEGQVLPRKTARTSD